jgi:hypothetical protein
MDSTELSVVLFQRDKWWVAQCLQFDIGAQGLSAEDAQYQFQRAVVGYIGICEAHGKQPFVDLAPAPQGYWKKFQGTRVRVEVIDGPAFRVPANCLPSLRPEFRLAA